MSTNTENDNSAVVCPTCKNCSSSPTDGSIDVQCTTESIVSKCQTWLEMCTIGSDGESTCSSQSSVTNSSSTSESTQDDECNIHDTVVCAQETIGAEIIRKTFSKQNSYGDVKIKDSRKVRLGNVTNIYGPVYITQAVSMVTQQSTTNQVFVDLPAPVIHGGLRMIYRKGWMALSPIQERVLLNGPAKFVVIGHTVSQPRDDTQASNTRLIQSIQRYHMTTNNFPDIGYNFLIGSDGNVYEGRGWSVESNHARRYNNIAVGISFVGYFCDNLPVKAALDQAQLLIKRGVALGSIDENYSLLAHCQCSETESPGNRLYQEIQKWDKWDCRIDVQHPSPLVSR